MHKQIVDTKDLVITTHANSLIMLHLSITITWNRQIGARKIRDVIWAEPGKGTNPIGTAIVKQAPTVIHADRT